LKGAPLESIKVADESFDGNASKFDERKQRDRKFLANLNRWKTVDRSYTSKYYNKVA
jgi:hypothetical protein